jgi:hypothetical protein
MNLTVFVTVVKDILLAVTVMTLAVSILELFPKSLTQVIRDRRR